MSRIRMKMDNEDSRKFWASFPESSAEANENIVLPSLGEPWWEAEKELSPTLLSVNVKKEGQNHL